jgi:uncharacterized protein
MDGVFDRRGLEVLGMDEALQLLASVPVGRIAFPHEGEAFVTPVNHRVAGRSVVFRTGRGTTFGAAWSERPVTFEADAFDPAARTGWSVVVRGTAIVVDDREEIAVLDALDLDPWVAVPDDASAWVRIIPNAVTGRRIVRPEHVEAVATG